MAAADPGARVEPGGTVGILGGGQLGRMLALAAARLGLKTHVYAPEGDTPAVDVAAARTSAPFDDPSALAAFAERVDVITTEFENVPAETLALLARQRPVAPSADAVAVAQDRLQEKTFVRGLGLLTADFAPVGPDAPLEAALGTIGRPAVLKTRRLGYDGKGQATIRDVGDEDRARELAAGAPCILEAFVPFECEISVIVARDRAGTVRSFEPSRNDHANHVLHRAQVPAGVPEGTAGAARDAARRIAEALDYIGVLGVEFFVLGDGRVCVNEIAPRVHNSGHWTQDACTVDQFEQHLRAICGWPLGEPLRTADVVMENLLGDAVLAWDRIATEPGAVLHLYGKRSIRPGRKMGHVNRVRPLPGQAGSPSADP